MEEENQVRTEAIKKLIFLVAFTGIMLIMSTYAWFSTQKNVTISGLKGNVNVAEGLQMSLDAQIWTNTIDLSKFAVNAATNTWTSSTYLTGAGTTFQQPYTYADGSKATNITPSEMLPASTTATTGEGIGSTALKMYAGNNTNSTYLDTIKQINELSATENPGYFAFDLFLQNTSASEATEDILRIETNSTVTVNSGKEATGLQNTVRVAFALYDSSAADLAVDGNTTSSEIIEGTKGTNISDVAIWEPNAYTEDAANDAVAHVPNIVASTTYLKLSNADATAAGLTYGGDGKTTAINATAKLPTYALKASAIDAEEISTTPLLKGLKNIYDWATPSTGLEKQITLQTPTAGIGEEPVELISIAKTEELDGTEVDPDTTFTIPANEYVKMRVYVWLEGQDVDCTNYASLGGGVTLNIGITKAATSSISDEDDPTPDPDPGNPEEPDPEEPDPTPSEPTTTLASVTNANIGDYIDLGNTIVGTTSTADDWRILYVEGETVYAILADYLPNSTNYAANAGLDTYSTYVVYSNTSRDTLLTGLTTTSYWNGLANGISGATVTGSPTVELLMSSYNTKNGTSLEYTECPILDSSTTDYDLYVPHTSGIDNCYGYWLASPYAANAFRVWYVLSSGLVDYYDSFDNGYYGVRPVVSLPSNISCSHENSIWTIAEDEIPEEDPDPTPSEPTTTLASVTNDNIGDYIDLGNTIVGTTSTADDWRILYVEGNTVYAILADYLPNSTNYATNAGLDTYSTYSVYSDTDRDTLLTGLTTASYWNGLANGISGATVTGSPTAELLMSSYNTKNGTNLDYTDYPYLDDETTDYDLYVPHTSDIDSCYGYWLASPYADYTNRVWVVAFNGFVGYEFSSYNTRGVRPVVSLPSNISCSHENWIWTIE